MNFCRNISNSSNAEKTLWKNLNPSSNFGAQTISCDLSNVDFSKSAVILKFKKGAKEEKTYEIRLNEGLNEVCVGCQLFPRFRHLPPLFFLRSGHWIWKSHFLQEEAFPHFATYRSL